MLLGINTHFKKLYLNNKPVYLSKIYRYEKINTHSFLFPFVFNEPKWMSRLWEN